MAWGAICNGLALDGSGGLILYGATSSCSTELYASSDSALQPHLEAGVIMTHDWGQKAP